MTQEEQVPSTPEATASVAQSRTTGAGDASGLAGRLRPAPQPFMLGKGVERAANAICYDRKRGDPLYRPLKIYTVDPSTRRLEGATTIINVPYEPLDPGPKGKRFHVVPSAKSPIHNHCEVDLEDPRILIRSGRDPAPSDAEFHHQMLYAVCSSIYAAFRAALGREIAWGFDSPTLEIEPHAFNDQQAWYQITEDDKSKKTFGKLQFGWLDASKLDNKVVTSSKLSPDTLTFSCLSHDVIAHELTHALLDGLRAQFRTRSGVDVDAFHEAFADIVAIFQRFSYREVIRTELQRTAGDLGRKSLLQRFVIEFSHAGGAGAQLRQVSLGDTPPMYDLKAGTYERASVLVSAVFDAFITIYRRRAAPLFRLATQGTGKFPVGTALPADLIDLLAHLVSRLASQFLSICIRAIDYCPPVNIEFGEYLRALITADYDLVPDDPWAYREAFIEAFARRRIFPREVKFLTEEALLWEGPPSDRQTAGREPERDPRDAERVGVPQRRPGKSQHRIPQLDIGNMKFRGDPASPASKTQLKRHAEIVGCYVTRDENLELFGLTSPHAGDADHDQIDLPCVESIRMARRIGPDGQVVFDLIAEVTQKRTVRGGDGYPEMDFYGGSTIIFGPKGEIRYIIRKKITNQKNIQRQRKFKVESEAEGYSLQPCILARSPKPELSSSS